MQKTRIGAQVEVDLFGLRRPDGFLRDVDVACGTIVAVTSGTVTIRLETHLGDHAEVTVGPGRLLSVGD
jgi:hypothetical protein